MGMVGTLTLEVGEEGLEGEEWMSTGRGEGEGGGGRVERGKGGDGRRGWWRCCKDTVRLDAFSFERLDAFNLNSYLFMGKRLAVVLRSVRPSMI